MNIWQHTSLVLGRNPKMPPLAQARVLAEPISFVYETRHSGIGTATQPDPAALEREALGWAWIAISAIADRVASLAPTIEVCRRVRRNGKAVLDPIEDHPLTRMLRSGSPVHPPSVVYRTMASHILTVGEAYLFKVRGSGLPMPVELWLGQPATIKPLVAAGLIVGYEVYDGTGARWTVDVRDTVRAWWPDPESLYTSEGKLGPQSIVVDANKFIDQTAREHFEHNAIPRVIMEANENAATSGALNPDEVAALNEQMRQRFSRRMGSQRGLPFWAPGGFKAHELSAMGGVEEVQAYKAGLRDQILAAFNVPKSAVGLTDGMGLGRAEAETNQYIMDVRAVKPVADLIAEALTTQLAVPDFDAGLVVRFPDFAPADKTFELLRDETELRTKLRSINEVRERKGDDPVEWGDLPVGTVGEAPYTGEEDLSTLPPDDPNALGDTQGGDTTDDDGPRSRAIERVRIDPKAEWQRVLARERKWPPAFRRAFLEVLTVQERAVQAAVAQSMERALEREPTLAELVGTIRATLAPARWAKLFERKTERVRKAAYISAGQEALKLVGAKGAFQLSTEVAQRLRLQGAQFAELVTNTTVKRVSAQVTEAMAQGAEAGEPLSQRAKRIEQAVGRGFLTRRNEARTIARTEMLRANTSAQLDGFERSGVVERKVWHTSMDDAVRDSHQIDGQTVFAHESFLLPATADHGAERADGPGVGADGAPLSAANTINCRCFVLPVIEE